MAPSRRQHKPRVGGDEAGHTRLGCDGHGPTTQNCFQQNTNDRPGITLKSVNHVLPLLHKQALPQSMHITRASSCTVATHEPGEHTGREAIPEPRRPVPSVVLRRVLPSKPKLNICAVFTGCWAADAPSSSSSPGVSIIAASISVRARNFAVPITARLPLSLSKHSFTCTTDSAMSFGVRGSRMLIALLNLNSGVLTSMDCTDSSTDTAPVRSTRGRR